VIPADALQSLVGAGIKVVGSALFLCGAIPLVYSVLAVVFGWKAER